MVRDPTIRLWGAGSSGAQDGTDARSPVAIFDSCDCIAGMGKVITPQKKRLLSAGFKERTSTDGRGGCAVLGKASHEKVLLYDAGVL